MYYDNVNAENCMKKKNNRYICCFLMLCLIDSCLSNVADQVVLIV